jgi:hypothetical protein
MKKREKAMNFEKIVVETEEKCVLQIERLFFCSCYFFITPFHLHFKDYL